MKVAYLLYPRFTALDVVGTFQVLAAAPGIQSVFVAARSGGVIDDTGLCALQAGACLADVVSADVVLVPGSECSCDPDPALVAWLRVVHPSTMWTLSVGTGSSYLAAAGALAGATATTHWASAQRLRDAGVTYSAHRVSRDRQRLAVRARLQRDKEVGLSPQSSSIWSPLARSPMTKKPSARTSLCQPIRHCHSRLSQP